MHVARGPVTTAADRPPVDHPKNALYDEAYDPLTIAWFAALADSPDVERLLREAPEYDLVANLQRFNVLFHDLMDLSLAEMHEKAADVVAVVSRYRDDVLWVGELAPGPDAGPAEIRESLSHKMKRNISLGVIEALICLESAYIFGRENLRLGGPALAETLRRSRQLYASLAVLHDEQERVRLTFLTGITGYLRYPQADYHHVITPAGSRKRGRFHIPADKFVVTGPASAPRLRFVNAPTNHLVLDSPIKRCPAHRFRSSQHGELTLNDVLWDLLIDIYRRSNRFAY